MVVVQTQQGGSCSDLLNVIIDGNVLLEHILHSLNIKILNVYLLLLAEDERGQYCLVFTSHLSVILWMNIALKTGDLAPKMIL